MSFRSLVPIEYPIVAFSHCRDVVAAVSRAGGLGVLGAATFSCEELEIELSWIDEHVGGRPYGVNVLAPAPSSSGVELDGGDDAAAYAARLPEGHRAFVADLIDRFDIPPPKTDRVPMPFGEGGLVVSRKSLQERIDIALSHPIRFLVSALGPFDDDTIRLAHEAGVLVGGMCGSVAHARVHRDSGADVVIAQGVEAAGHTGEISTMVLVPQVVDAVSPLPVLAAGGIGCGRQVAAAMALGAQGVWMGSIWLTTQESDADEVSKQKMLRADSGDTLRSRCLTGKPVRQLRTPWVSAWEQAGAPSPLPAPLQGLLVKDSIAGIMENRVESLIGASVGQVVGMMSSERSVRAVVDDLMSELVDTVARLEQDMIGAGDE